MPGREEAKVQLLSGELDGWPPMENPSQTPRFNLLSASQYHELKDVTGVLCPSGYHLSEAAWPLWSLLGLDGSSPWAACSSPSAKMEGFELIISSLLSHHVTGRTQALPVTVQPAESTCRHHLVLHSTWLGCFPLLSTISSVLWVPLTSLGVNRNPARVLNHRGTVRTLVKKPLHWTPYPLDGEDFET